MVDLVCRCGHQKSTHTRITGPNSIGQHFFQQCANGWHHSTGHLFGFRESCPCDGYRLRWWWPWSGKGVRS